MDFQVDRNYTRKLVVDISSLIIRMHSMFIWFEIRIFNLIFFFCHILVGLPLLLLNTIASPYKRGFYCNN